MILQISKLYIIYTIYESLYQKTLLLPIVLEGLVQNTSKINVSILNASKTDVSTFSIKNRPKACSKVYKGEKLKTISGESDRSCKICKSNN